MSTSRPTNLPIDVSPHLAAREAMRGFQQRVLVTRETFGADGHTARVLINGDYYDVNIGELDRLKAGAKLTDLEIYPVAGD
ncbi:MAG: hypothetical protein IBJ07_10595 [Rhizobiaceae bacterium]|nr:hypothetical protein [Rhizobiaceae bacterium]